jgi:hypothetical protein
LVEWAIELIDILPHVFVRTGFLETLCDALSDVGFSGAFRTDKNNT